MSCSLTRWSSPRVGSSSRTTAGDAVSCTASTRPSRCPSDRSRGCWSPGRPGTMRSTSARQVPGSAPASRSACLALLVDGGEVEEVGGRLRDERRPVAQRGGRVGAVDRTVPAWRGPAGCSAHSSDDLPEPLRPMTASTCPRGTCEVDPTEGDDVAVADHQPAPVEPVPGSGGLSSRRPHRAPGGPGRGGARAGGRPGGARRAPTAGRIPTGQPAELHDRRRQRRARRARSAAARRAEPSRAARPSRRTARRARAGARP